jgi:hypothetical protein
MNRLKLIISLIGIFFICLVSGYLGYKIYQLTRTTEELNQHLQEANLELGKAQTTISDRDISIASLSADIQKYLKENKELVVKYNQIVALYNSHNHGSSNGANSNNPPIHIDSDLYKQGDIYLAISKNDLLE